MTALTNGRRLLLFKVDYGIEAIVSFDSNCGEGEWLTTRALQVSDVIAFSRELSRIHGDSHQPISINGAPVFCQSNLCVNRSSAVYCALLTTDALNHA